MDIDHIRAMWQAGDVEYGMEARQRLLQREVTTENVGEAIMSGWFAEERQGKRYLKARVQGWANRKVAGLEVGLHLLNVVCSVGEALHIVTVYWEEPR